MSSIAQNIKNIEKKIDQSAKACGRDADHIHLVAVSKKQPASRIDEAIKAGHKVFGENRVQEAYEHWEERKKEYPEVKLHMIGPLQTNKVKDAVRLFDCFETLDRHKLAKKLADEMAAQGKDLPCFIQVNTGKEKQKFGVLPEHASEFYDYCRYECGLDIKGLMCIPPVDASASLHFALLKKLADEIGLSELSMGMSADFEQAIPHGASYVRVGTSLFGDRE